MTYTNLVMEVELVLFFKQKTAYEVRISDWSSDVCSSDLIRAQPDPVGKRRVNPPQMLGLPIQQCPERLPSDFDPRQTHISAWPGTSAGTRHRALLQIGRASCRERVCQYV